MSDAVFEQLVKEEGEQKEGLRRRRRTDVTNKNNNHRLTTLKPQSEPQFDQKSLYGWFSSVGSKATQALKEILVDDDRSASVDEDELGLLGDADADQDSDDDIAGQSVEGVLYGNSSDSVGFIHLHLISATKTTGVSDAAEGDHYTIITIDEVDQGPANFSNNHSYIDQEHRTKTVHTSATPVFDKKWKLNAPAYHSCLRVSLINRSDNTVVGVSKISVHALILGKHGRTVKKGDVQVWEEENVQMRSPDDPITVLGFFTLKIRFEEDTKSLYAAKRPVAAKSRDDEVLSVERLVKHINRLTTLVSVAGDVFGEYMHLMNWNEPLFTLFVFVVFVYVTLTISAEYALSPALLLVVLLFVRTWARRVTGAYTKKVSEKVKIPNEPYRPLAMLRLAIVDIKYGADPLSPSSVSVYSSNASSGSSRASWTSKRPFISVSYRPIRGDYTKFKKVDAQKGSVERREFLVGTVCNSGDIEGGSKDELQGALYCNMVDLWPQITPVRKSDSSSLLSSLSTARLFESSSKGPSSARKIDLCFVYPVLQPLWKQVVPEEPKRPRVLSEDQSPTTLKRFQPKRNPNHYVPWTENSSELALSFSSSRPGKGLMDSLAMNKSIGTVRLAIKDIYRGSYSGPTVSYNHVKDNIREILLWAPVLPDASKHVSVSNIDI